MWQKINSLVGGGYLFVLGKLELHGGFSAACLLQQKNRWGPWYYSLYHSSGSRIGWGTVIFLLQKWCLVHCTDYLKWVEYPCTLIITKKIILLKKTKTHRNGVLIRWLAYWSWFQRRGRIVNIWKGRRSLSNNVYWWELGGYYMILVFTVSLPSIIISYFIIISNRNNSSLFGRKRNGFFFFFRHEHNNSLVPYLYSRIKSQ